MVTSEVMYVIAKILKNHPEYLRSYHTLELDTQKMPKVEHFLNIPKRKLAKLQFFRDGIKPSPEAL